jgi:hypothetical protein
MSSKGVPVTQYSFDARTEFDTIATARDCPQARTSRLKRILGLSSVGFLLLLTGCGSTTVFQSSFNSNGLGASTGTVVIPQGSVVSVSTPPNTTGYWAQIQRAAPPGSPISTLQCNLSQVQQTGSYSFVAVLYIPSPIIITNRDAKAPSISNPVEPTNPDATVEFDTSPQGGPPSQSFLHLDFTPNNTVRINDDNNQVFGTFPRDQFFTLAVSLVITSTSAAADLNLYGSGASGTKHVDINNVPISFPQQFGEVQFYMGFPWNGSFDVSNILVTRKK